MREWAEEHWAGVAVTVSIASAIAVSAILIVCFNVLMTRLP
jgi:hypothetical protein